MNLKGIVAASAVIGLVFGLAGCSSDSGSGSSSTTTSKEAVCADRAALLSSMEALTSGKSLSGGKSTLESALKKVQKNLTALKASAKADLKPKVDAVKTALEDLKTVVDGFGSGSVADNVTEAGDAISDVGSAVAKLAVALNTECSS